MKLSGAIVIITAAAITILVIIKVKQPVDTDDPTLKEPVVIDTSDKTSIKLSKTEQIEAYKKEEYTLAESLFTEFPGHAEPYFIMGNYHRRHGNSEEAVKMWNKVIQIDPSRADALNEIALVEMEKGQFEDARNHWLKVLLINPGFENIHTGIGQTLASQGKYEQALEHYLTDMKISTPTAVRYYFTGQAWFKLQEYEKAKQAYQQALQIDPEHVNSHFGLATVFARLKNTEEAKKYRESFQKLKKPEDNKSQTKTHSLEDDVEWVKQGLVSVYIEAQSLYLSTGNVKKAEELLKKASRLDPKNPDVARKFAVFYRMTERPQKALQMCLLVTRLDPEDISAHYLAGDLAAQMGQFAQAENCFNNIITLFPDLALGYRELARLFVKMNRYGEAKDWAGQAITKEKNAENHFVYAMACEGLDQIPEAISAVTHAVELDNENTIYKRYYGYLQNKLDK